MTRMELADLAGKLQFEQLRFDLQVQPVPIVLVIQALPWLSIAIPFPL